MNLPQTTFPMKANSTVREVEIQKLWDEKKIYERNIEQRKEKEKFVLHDGPPYLSSPRIHIGTALNKILKDIVTKYKAQHGYYTPYVPGYDSHGLPIENAVLKNAKGGRSAFASVELRQKCREFALENLKGQSEGFRRLGVWGDWEHPYITLDSKFEARQIEVFGKMAAKGYLYKGLKPVYWCSHCETALAEAEVEYSDVTSQSIIIKFTLTPESRAQLAKHNAEVAKATENVSVAAWTTTPWSLLGVIAVALSPEFKYQALKIPGQPDLIVVVAARKEFLLQQLGIEDKDVKVIAEVTGKDLHQLTAVHPLTSSVVPLIFGEHVSDGTGTGAVTTAPGHGLEDYEAAIKYKLPIVSPVDGAGVFTVEGGEFEGLRYDKAVPKIIESMQAKKTLLHNEPYVHSYPHCWRCKHQVFYRATEQWFASVEGFRKQALDAIKQVTWIPASGEKRIYNMVENRSDWCISRQRAWGVPIPAFYCKKCHKLLLNLDAINRVADVFREEGSDSWWNKDADYFLQGKFTCESCGNKEFDKETDTMDVWFDSGSSHYCVLDARPELKGTPCEMYLEGSDQHRGWFHSSLLVSVALHGRAPYKNVLTHGFIMSEDGRKMSKSLGNTVEPGEVIKDFGADVLRLWVASVNYTDDVPIGKNMLVQLAEVYRKLRNTARYLLGNLYDFNPQTDSIEHSELLGIDQYILHKLQTMIEEVVEDFDKYEFFKFYQLLQNFCVVDLSSLYFDLAKDRLYTAAPKSLERRSAQTVLYHVLQALVRMLVPVTPHLAEDIWQHMPEALRESGKESVLLTDFPKTNPAFKNDELAGFWEAMLRVKYTVNKALELARAEGKIGSSLEAQVQLGVEDTALKQKVVSIKDDLASLFITSQAALQDDTAKSNGALSHITEEGITATVYPASGVKCARCWKFTDDVGSNSNYPDLCAACAKALV